MTHPKDHEALTRLRGVAHEILEREYYLGSPEEGGMSMVYGKDFSSLSEAAHAWEDFANDLTTALDLITRLEAEGEWQPIETAPRDGTEVLAAGCKRGPPIRIISWGSGRYNRSSKSYDRTWTDGPSYGFEPTHWRSLPAPPALQASQPKDPS